MAQTYGGRRFLRDLDRAEALLRLGGVSFGRVIFTQHALPAVRPVNHLVDRGQIIIRSHEGSAIVTAARRGSVLAFEADEIDPVARAGWSIVATGLAWLVDNAEEAARYREALEPWLAEEMAHVIRIDPEVITGFELIPASRS